MDDNPKLIAFCSLLGVVAVVYVFWSLFGDEFLKRQSAAVGESDGPIIIRSLDDLPEGMPPPPAPPEFNKNSFQIPGTTDGMATPTDSSL